MIIAIDGPAGAGKSTTARAVARELGFAYIDTGAMYRAVALVCGEQGLSCDNNRSEIAAIAQSLPLRFGAGGTQLFIDERDVSTAIREGEIGSLASQVAALGEVRQHIVARQRTLGEDAQRETGGAVLEGRDIQTVVFPDAELKIFLTASPTERARRRLEQWQQTGKQVELEEAEKDVTERDARDEAREVSPLKAAPDAVHLITDGLSPVEVAEKIIGLAREKMSDV